MGSVNCQGFGYNVPPNPLLLGYNQQGYRGEYYMPDGTVAQKEWSPNRLSFDISATAATTLVINQNFDIDWQVESGNGTMTSDHGRLAVEVPAGHQRLSIFYEPEHMMLALLLTVIGWIAFVLLWWWERPRAARVHISVDPDDSQRASAE
jgi:uncharacterized membrane protein YfhO